MMEKKNLRSVAAALAPVAQGLPTQNVVRAMPPSGAGEAHRAPAANAEPLVQFSFALRKSLRKELARLADDADMTMRAFILEALRDKGLTVTDDDLLDMRKRT